MNDIKKNIVYHLYKHKEHLIQHTKKLQRKYHFIFNPKTGRNIIKIIVIIGLFLGISTLTQTYYINQGAVKMYKIIDEFDKIYNIARQEMNESGSGFTIFDEESRRLFNALDEEFHNAPNVTAKFKAAKKMVDFLTSQEVNHPNIGFSDGDAERDKKLIDLLNEFNRLNP